MFETKSKQTLIDDVHSIHTMVENKQGICMHNIYVTVMMHKTLKTCKLISA